MDQSIFNLIENPNDLPSSNENMSELYYREVLPTRDVTDNATQSSYRPKFGGTNISIRWSLDNRTWWIPSRSYIKLDVELTKPGESGDNSTQLKREDEIAPNMGFAPSVFNRMQVKMNDTTVSQISQFIPQCDTIANRVYNSSVWLNKTNGNSSNFWEAYQGKRLQDVSSDGNISDYFIPSVQSSQNPANLGFITSTKEELGLGPVVIGNTTPTTAISISQNQVLTFTALSLFVIPDIRGIFQPGDIISLKLRTAAPATEAFRRLFFVVELINATSMLVGRTQGTELAAAIGNNGDGGSDLILYRHQLPIDVLQKPNVVDLIASTVAVAGATEIITIGVGQTIANKVDQGDIFLTPSDGATREVSKLIVNPNDVQSLQGSKSGQSADINAANLDIKLFKYSDVYKFAQTVDLGYDYPPAQNNSHAVALTPAANGTLFTQAVNASAQALPNVNDIWNVGDWIIIKLNAGDYRYFFVEQVDPDQTGNTLLLQGSLVIGANAGGLGDGRNYVFGRLRYSPDSQALESANGINIAKKKSRFDVCWKPSCLSIFNYPGAIPGGTKFELELQAESNKYVGLAIETPFGVRKSGRLSSDLTLNPADYQLLIKNIKFYICVAQGPAVGQEEYAYYINLNEIRTHKRKIQNRSLTQTSLDVMPSSYALALAFQDSRAIDSSATDVSVTKFKVNGAEESEELALVRYSLRFAGLSLPQPDADIRVGSAQEFLNNQYLRNQLYTNQYFKNAGGESLEEWKERGIYFYHPFIRSAGNKEARAYIITQFNENGADPNIKQMSEEGLNNLQAFLFEFYRAFALVKMKNGFVYSVSTANQ